jgi:hypothetical protein
MITQRARDVAKATLELELGFEPGLAPGLAPDGDIRDAFRLRLKTGEFIVRS